MKLALTFCVMVVKVFEKQGAVVSETLTYAKPGESTPSPTFRL